MKRSFIKTDGRHRRLEGWPFIFSALILISILVGSLAEFIPMVLVSSNVPTIEAVKPYTALEIAGRDVYIKEGCNNCHSQQVRPFRHELERYGEYSKPGEGVYEHPFLWGSKRTGPDLSRIGGKYPHLWHVRHMEDPRSTSPRSIMPPYPWMLTKAAPLDRLPARLRALKAVGVPYSDAEIQSATEDAMAQGQVIADEISAQGGPLLTPDRQIIAMVAYLQRLGADIRLAEAPVGAPASSQNNSD